MTSFGCSVDVIFRLTKFDLPEMYVIISLVLSPTPNFLSLAMRRKAGRGTGNKANHLLGQLMCIQNRKVVLTNCAW